MADFGLKLATLVKPCVLALALALPFAVGAMPARAQDIFGFFRALSRPAQPVQTIQPFEYNPGPAVEQPKRRARPRPKPVVAEQPAMKLPITPKPPGAIENPVPALLADSTLRPGDMVMFPDGLRVFTGKVGGQHKLADFRLLSQVGKAVPQATRKLVAKLRPGENVAWSSDAFRTDSKLAVNTKDVGTTGSVRRTGSRRDLR
jgi:hypothetical protein